MASHLSQPTTCNAFNSDQQNNDGPLPLQVPCIEELRGSFSNEIYDWREFAGTTRVIPFSEWPGHGDRGRGFPVVCNFGCFGEQGHWSTACCRYELATFDALYLLLVFRGWQVLSRPSKYRSRTSDRTPPPPSIHPTNFRS